MPISLGPNIDSQNHTKQAFYKRLSVIAGFVLLLIVVVGDALIVRHELDIQIANQDWVTHTRQILFELERTESLIKDAESGQRGYLYTGDSKYLSPYYLAIAQAQQHLDNLAQLTANSPVQRERIPVLRNLIQAKFAELAQTLSLYQSGKVDDAKELVKSDTGLVAMNNIRSLIGQMEMDETSLEPSQAAAYQLSRQLTMASNYLASFFATLCLILMAYHILREIDRREKYLLDIKSRAEWYRITLTCIGDAVIATDQGGNVTFLNPVAEVLTGFSFDQAIGTDVLDVFPISNELTKQPAENPVRKVLEQGKVVGLSNHTVLKRRDGTLIPIEDSAAPIWNDRGSLIGVVLVFRDVSLERKTREVMRKTEKLAAAARLSATVAHEINNPLEAVVNLVYLAKAAPDAPSSVVQPLIIAEQELERIAHITRQTLGFYRESSVPELIEMSALLDSVLKLYSNKFEAKNITVERHFEECPRLLGVPGELKQVVSNLISNATDAVSRDGTIAVGAWCADDPGGKTIHVLIEDDGPGVAPEDLDRIFEPFFTTKKDVGTGLGLWVTKEIVDRHGGSIEVNPRNHGVRGAAFSILLPCTPEPPNGLPKES